MLINDVEDKAGFSSIIISELRECYGIKFRKEKKQKHINEKLNRRKIFNVSLDKLELTDVILAHGVTQVPVFVADACQRILELVSTEGLFRKAGSSARQREIRTNLEAGARLGKSHHVIDVANILKSFFRELPEAILPPGNIQDSMLRCLLCGDRKTDALMMTCLLLPPLSLNTLTFFMQFLNTVSMHSDRNKMTVENLSIIFAPGLMPLEEIIPQRLNSHCKIIQMLIEQAREIGILPKHILNKVQQLKKPISTLASNEIISDHIAVADTEKKKKKRRSGSLTRMFNGLRKIVGALGSTENLDKTPELNEATPCISKSTKKRKVMEGTGLSAKKKKDVLALMPQNGGLLPHTPGMCNKVPKKSRLSLGGKRHVTKQQTVILNANPPMERRWSVVGTGWNKKKNEVVRGTKVNTENNLKEVLDQTVRESDDYQFRKDSISPIYIDGTEGVNKCNDTDPDFMRISKSEYEAIKERVSAIETRISQEFNNVHATMRKSEQNDVDAQCDSNIMGMNGPEKVLDKYEKTLEETGSMSSASTDLLAKRLSRELKIRRSTDHQVIRSPSARKIGTMRRRSRENVRLSRNQSWHLGARPSSITYNQPELMDIALPPSLDLSFYPKVSLKRGRPNTILTGLKIPSPSKKIPTDEIIPSVKPSTIDITNECWTNADAFFNNTPTMAQRHTPIKCKEEEIPATPYFVTKIALGEMKTPMLPPRVPIRRTPLQMSNNKTPMLPPKTTCVRATPSLSIKKTLLTPLQQDQQTGRASIARLRSQNAGMVAAKAKLFNGFATETLEICQSKQLKGNQQNERQSMQFVEAEESCPSLDQIPLHQKEVAHIKHINRREHANQNSPRKSTPRRGCNTKHLNGIQRRQKLRLGKSPVKKSPMHLKHFKHSEMLTMQCSPNLNDDKKSAKKKNENVYVENVRPKLETPHKPKENSLEQFTTPHIKRPLIINSPRRLLKSQHRETKRSSPLRATPLKLRHSPRLSLTSKKFN